MGAQQPVRSTGFVFLVLAEAPRCIRATALGCQIGQLASAGDLVYIPSHVNRILSRSFIMSPAETELAYRAALRALPDFRFGHDQLVRLLRALRPPPPGAPVALRHAHLERIIEEVRALDPRNALDAMLVMQIIASRHAAADAAHMSLDPTASARQAAGMRRNAEELLRVARQMERLLKTERVRRVAPGQAPAEVAFDLAALDAIWCGTASQTPVPGVDPVGLRSDGHAGVAGPSPAAPSEARQPAAAPDPIGQVKYTLCGERIDLVRLATIPVAGTA
jgi:hypothetical protein